MKKFLIVLQSRRAKISTKKFVADKFIREIRSSQEKVKA